MQKDLEALQAILKLAQQREGLADSHLQGLVKLHLDGFVSDRDVALSTADALQRSQENAQLIREQMVLRRQLEEARNSLAALPSEHAQQRLSLANQHSELQQRIVQIERQRSAVVIAPRDGRVSHINVRQGHHLSSGQVLMTLTPALSTIEAKMVVPIRAAGFLATGQAVTLRYDAFPYQKYGLHRGHITSISETLILPKDWPDAPRQLQEPGYLVRVRLASNSLVAHGSIIGLKSGMTFSADIQLGERTLIEWLFAPLQTITGRLSA